METSQDASAEKREFDPIAYIESAFKEDGASKQNSEDQENLEIPSIKEFMSRSGVLEEAPVSKNGTAVKTAPKRASAPRKASTNGKLSAPRPRRTAKDKKAAKPIDTELTETWQLLPKNITFLSSFFDDAVTANYYRGEFKESREELIRRLLDPELTLEEVSRLLGVCPATVRRYTNRGWLDHHRTQGGQRRFRLTGVVKFVEEHGRH